MSGFFTDTATIYNYYKNQETEKDTWNRTVIKGAQWRHGKQKISVVDGVATETNAESITIDFQRGYGNKPYVTPQEYAKLTAEEAKEHWTLNEVDAMDYIVCGEVETEITRPRDLEVKHTVVSVADNRNRPRLKHIKVVAQ